MFRKLFAAFVLLTAGFIGGLMLTARLHISDDPLAADLKPTAAAAPGPAAGGAAPPTSPAPIAQAAVAGGGPDFTRIAGTAVKGVANISSLQVQRRPNSPFS